MINETTFESDPREQGAPQQRQEISQQEELTADELETDDFDEQELEEEDRPGTEE
jgi:hypothetical protein